jgi:hypothetical protein
MNKKQTLLNAFKGHFVSGSFTKVNGNVRHFHGRLIEATRDSKNHVTVWDADLHQYRRFNLNAGELKLRKRDVTLELK